MNKETDDIDDTSKMTKESVFCFVIGNAEEDITITHANSSKSVERVWTIVFGD